LIGVAAVSAAAPLPAVPDTVSVVLLPVPAVEAGVSVKVLAAPAATLVGLNVAVTPAGRPLTDRLTVPANPFAAITVIPSVAELPPEQKTKMQVGGVTVRLALLGDSVNEGLARTEKVCTTGLAAAYLALPDCEATIVHEPGAISVAVAPETVQTAVVLEAKLTASPELADALRLALPPTVWVAMAANVIVWVCGTTVNDWDALGAAA
jgi:hypothetical protein